MKPTDEMVEAGAKALNTYFCYSALEVDGTCMHSAPIADCHLCRAVIDVDRDKARAVLTAALASQPEAGAEAEIAKFANDLASRQEPLGAEFEAVWSENVEELYESAPAPSGMGKAVEETTLAECPVGLFWSGDDLCLKTEYGNNDGRLDAYIVSTGEFFWGSAPQTIPSQRAQIVTPVAREALSALKAEEAGS